MNAGEDGRELLGLGLRYKEEDSRDWNRRSKGRKEGVGESRPGREATEGSTLLLGEERIESCENDGQE